MAEITHQEKYERIKFFIINSDNHSLVTSISLMLLHACEFYMHDASNVVDDIMKKYGKQINQLTNQFK